MSRRFHFVYGLILLAAGLLAQEPGAPTFDSSAKLVLVPFHVERGKYFAADLQASDFILREDGHPREFTTFEGPNTAHPLPLELILLFDTAPSEASEKRAGLAGTLAGIQLDPKEDYEFLRKWDESITRDVLGKNGMDIRIAVYHYAGQQLERLCAASSDPREVAGAFQALLNPIPTGKGELTLLPGDYVPKLLADAHRPWMSEAIVGALEDAAASPIPARRLLIVFTDGGNGTSSKPPGFSNIVDSALSMNVPIDSVIMEWTNRSST